MNEMDIEPSKSSSYPVKIGAGGSGTIYQLDQDTVIKAIYSTQSCTEAKIEFDKQDRIYNAFELIRSRKEEAYPSLKITSEELVETRKLIDNIAHYIRVSKPIKYQDEAFMLHKDRYECSVTMTKLNAIPLNVYMAFDKDYVNSKFDSNYLKEIGDDYGLMGQLALNSEVSGIFGIQYSKTKISSSNPPRGFFITSGIDVLQFFRDEYGLRLSDNELKEMIGFIYGYIYYASHIIPIDIEITLGIDKETSQFEVNVLDFGMTFDKINIEPNPKVIRGADFFRVYHDENIKTEEEREALILEKASNDIGIDLYGSREDSFVEFGFQAAYQVVTRYNNLNLLPSISSLKYGKDHDDEEEENLTSKCHTCKSVIRDGNVFLCGGPCIEKVFYCGTSCQVKDWKNHLPFCKER